jgi:hypothetical protein
MSYPATVSYFVRRLQGHTTNTFRLEPNGTPGTSTAGLGSNSILVFELPSNTLLDFSSLQMWFNAKTVGANSRLPNDMSQFIERYSIECGGQTIAQGFSSYGLVKSVKNLLYKNNVGEYPGANKNGIPRQVDPINGGTITNAPAASGTTADQVVASAQKYDEYYDPFVIDDWCGFLGECKPQIIDTSLLGSLTLKIFLAEDAVVTQSKANDSRENFIAEFVNVAGSNNARKGATYQIFNVRMHATVYGINDGSYDMMIENQLNTNEFLEVPFTNYQTFFDGAHSGSSRFNIATQSLDKLYAVWREANYSTQGAPKAICGTASDLGIGGYQLLDSEHLGEKYTNKYFNFPWPTDTDNAGVQSGGLATAQFQLNGAMYPQFQANPDEWLGITKDAVHSKKCNIPTFDFWYKHAHIHAIRLNHPNSEELRVLSGLDTRSMNLSGVYQTTGINTPKPCTIIAQMTNTLRIGKGLAVNLIV